MSYTYSNEIKYADGANLDAFGRLRTAGITTLIDVKHLFDKLPLTVDEKIGGGATSIWSNASVAMSTSANNDFVVRQSIKSAPYQSGKSQLFEASFKNFNLETNVTKRVGYFTATAVSPFNSGFDGFFLESNGSTGVISFQIWKGGVNTLTVNSASWYTTEYDVSLIDWSKTQLMLVDFQWLGVGRLRFYMVIDGTPRLFYANVGMNNLAAVYMDNSNKPIRYEIRQSGAGSGSFGMICSGVSMEGGINETYYNLAVNDFTERTLAVAATTYAVLGIRLNGTTSYAGVSAQFSKVEVLQTSNDNYLVTVQRNPTLSAAAAWNALTNTPLEYSYGTGALTVSSAGHIINSTMGKSGSLSTDSLAMGDSVFSLGYRIDGAPEEWWVCIQATSNNAKVRTGVNLKYFK